LLDLILVIDASFIAFNKEKRVLHDYLAMSYVVTNQSLVRAKRSRHRNDDIYSD